MIICHCDIIFVPIFANDNSHIANRQNADLAATRVIRSAAPFDTLSHFILRMSASRQRTMTSPSRPYWTAEVAYEGRNVRQSLLMVRTYSSC